MRNYQISEEEVENFANSLNDWVNQATNEERAEAADRMIEAFRSNSINLNLSDLFLSSLPPEIGNLIRLNELIIHNSQIREIPPEIGNLTNLKKLIMPYNQIRDIPPEIGNLINLEKLIIPCNQIIGIPPEIGNLINLKILSLSTNQITEIPPEIYNLTNIEILNLSHNQITEAPEINSLINLILLDFRGNPVEQDPSFGLLDPSSYTQSRTVLREILKLEINKDDLENFINNTSDDFQKFLEECSKTKSWEEHPEEMASCLLKIIEKMKTSQSAKEYCELIATQASGTCGDRVALVFARMQIALDLTDIPVQNMTISELHENFKTRAVANFLLEEAEKKIAVIKTSNPSFEEDVEVYLAYLQPCKDLGLNLDGLDMIYRNCSEVSDEDLQIVVSEIERIGQDELTAKFIYDDDLLKLNPVVQNIITKTNERLEFSTDQTELETDQEYLQRCSALEKSFSDSVVKNILNAVTLARMKNNSESEEEMLSETTETPSPRPENIAEKTQTFPTSNQR